VLSYGCPYDAACGKGEDIKPRRLCCRAKGELSGCRWSAEQSQAFLSSALPFLGRGFLRRCFFLLFVLLLPFCLVFTV
jgi:hypothetical protein